MIIVFVVFAFALYGVYAALKNVAKKAVKVYLEIRKEKNKTIEGGDLNT